MRRRLLFLSLITMVILGFGGIARAATPSEPHGQDDGKGQDVSAEHANEHADEAGPEAGHDDSPANPTPGGALTGSVKVDDVDLDNVPANGPHQACQLRIAVRHPADGPLQLTFEAQPPTTRAGDNQVLFTTVAPAGVDSSEVVDLTSSLEGITPQPEQGFHVKLTVAPVDSADHPAKHKVFWVEACPAPVVVPTISGTSTQAPEAVPTQVLGEQFTKPAAAPQGELALTGSPFPTWLGMLLAGAGLLLLTAVRRPSLLLLPARAHRR